MCVGRTAEGVSVVSDRELLVRFVTVDGENPTRKVPERHKIFILYVVGGGEERKYKKK